MRLVRWPLLVHFPGIILGMPPKNSKPRLISRKHSRPLDRGKRKPIAGLRINTKPATPLPDTSRIPWFSAIPKTGTDA